MLAPDYAVRARLFAARRSARGREHLLGREGSSAGLDEGNTVPVPASRSRAGRCTSSSGPSVGF